MPLSKNTSGKNKKNTRKVATQPSIAEHQLTPSPEGTRIYQKPTASSEGAQLWDKHHLTISWFRKAGPTILMCQSRSAEPAAPTISLSSLFLYF